VIQQRSAPAFAQDALTKADRLDLPIFAIQQRTFPFLERTDCWQRLSRPSCECPRKSEIRIRPVEGQRNVVVLPKSRPRSDRQKHAKDVAKASVDLKACHQNKMASAAC